MAHHLKDHLLLDARTGWRDAILDPTLRKNSDGSISLRPQPGSVRPLVDAAGSFGGLAWPTGLAVSADDQLYILDHHAALVKQFDPCSTTFKTLSCIGGTGRAPRRLHAPRGLAVSCRGDLYIADTGNRRVQIFALKGLPLRAIWGPFQVLREEDEIRVRATASLPPPNVSMNDCLTEASFAEETWQPWDIVLSDDNWAFVSDYENGLIHVFDPCGRWHTAYTGESDEAAPLEKPTHLAIDTECRLYVVQEGKDYVTVLDAEGKFVEQVKSPLEVKDRFCPVAVAIDRDGNLCISDCLTRHVYAYSPTASGSLQAVGAWRAFEGVGTGLAFDSAGNALVADAEHQLVCRMEADVAFELEGRYYSEPLDSRLYRCQWHRIVLCAAILAGTQLRVDTFSSESPKTAAEIKSLPEMRWATAQTDAQVDDAEWDCLIQSPPGRYLWLRLTFNSEGAASPILRSVRAYYPRSSSLQYLPAVYSEDAPGRDFMDRFLSIFDTIWNGISDQITGMARYFDPAATPTETKKPGDVDFLSWLASWLDLSLDRHWPEEKRRRLLEQAHRLYALRGTPEGLRMHVQLYTDVEPRILEHFKLRRWTFVNHVRLGDQTALWGETIVKRLQLDGYSRIGEFQLIDSGDPLRDPFHHDAHQFTIFVPLRGPESETQKQTLDRIVEMAKPAHTLGQVSFVQPRFRVGLQSFVGVDTVIGRYPDQTVMGEARLGFDSALGPSSDEAQPPTMRVGVRTRIGSSTLID